MGLYSGLFKRLGGEICEVLCHLCAIEEKEASDSSPFLLLTLLRERIEDRSFIIGGGTFYKSISDTGTVVCGANVENIFRIFSVLFLVIGRLSGDIVGMKELLFWNRGVSEMLFCRLFGDILPMLAMS